jgi:predicted DNA-binding transcriptional regulator AlpA
MLKLLNSPPASPFEQAAIPEEQSLSVPLLKGFLRREELATQLGLSARTIDRWQTLRQGPPRVHVGRTILYNVESVRDWLRSQEKQLCPKNRRRSFSLKKITTKT